MSSPPTNVAFTISNGARLLVFLYLSGEDDKSIVGNPIRVLPTERHWVRVASSFNDIWQWIHSILVDRTIQR